MRIDRDDFTAMNGGEIDRLLAGTAADVQQPALLWQARHQAQCPLRRRAIAGTFAGQALMDAEEDVAHAGSILRYTEPCFNAKRDFSSSLHFVVVVSPV